MAEEDVIQESVSEISDAVAANYAEPPKPIVSGIDVSRIGGAKIGDFVVVRYNDTNKLRRILLSSTENNPDQGVVHVKQPLGAAILGANVDDEIEFPHGRATRTAVIERIEQV